MIVSLLFSILNILVNLPTLFNVIVDLLLVACIIPLVTHFIDVFPNNQWCQIVYRYPGTPKHEPIYLDPKCGDWRLVAKIMMGITAGFGGILRLVDLLLLIVIRVILTRPSNFFFFFFEE
jgi:hypothetical protein